MTELNDADLPPVTAALLGKHFAKFPEHLTVTRWKDGIDISDPIFEIKALCRDYARQAIKDYLAKQEVVWYEYRVELEDGVWGGWLRTSRSYYEGLLARPDPSYEVRSLIVKEELK